MLEILLDAVRFEDGRFAGADSQHAYEAAHARYSMAQAILARHCAPESTVRSTVAVGDPGAPIIRARISIRG